MLTLTAARDFTAMGVRCRIEVTSSQGPSVLDLCIDQVNELEALWSRFRSTSDISRLNNSQGDAVWVDKRTIQLVTAMQHAHTATNGSFNPTRLPEQIQAGDATSLGLLGTTTIPADTQPFESLHDISISDSKIALPAQMTLDAGGIGKGFAADLVAEHARQLGANAVLVNLGGDIRVSQDLDSRHDFPIDVLSADSSARVISTISLRQGAIATSAKNARWRNGRGVSNHIMGAADNIDSASVIASSAMWADVWAKHLIVSPTGLTDLEQHGLSGLIQHTDGRIEKTDSWKEFEQC